MRVSKKDYGQYLAILLLIILGTYLHFNPLTEDTNDVESKKVFLKERPALKERGEERQKYIRIVDTNQSYFDISNCALLKTKTDALLKLNAFDSLTLGIRKSKTFTERFNGETDVLYITSTKYGIILGLDDYNKCQTKSGTITPYLILGVIAILIFRIIDRHRKGVY